MPSLPRKGRLVLAVLSVALAGVAPAVPTARAANILEKQIYMSGPRYDGDLPACEAGLSTIASRFATKESRFWNSTLEILDFEKVREIAYSPWATGTVPRRFCSATAMVSDGRKHAVYYSIAEDAGEIGLSWGVDWCVVGLDRNGSFNPRCKMAQP